MAALLVMLDDRLRAGSKLAEDDVRRQQIGSGMRGDKRRTYRFQDDHVVDRITGKSMQASNAMKGASATCGDTSMRLPAVKVAFECIHFFDDQGLEARNTGCYD